MIIDYKRKKKHELDRKKNILFPFSEKKKESQKIISAFSARLTSKRGV